MKFMFPIYELVYCIRQSETHRQLTDEQLAAAGIDQGLVRLSVGLENVEDIIDDLKQAFSGG